MILFDLDDTLLNTKKEITKKSIMAIKEVYKKGIMIGYITARSPRKVGKFLKDLPCDTIAYYNGAKVLCNDILISNICIPFLEGYRLIKEIKEKYPACRVNAYFEPYCYNFNNVYKIGESEILCKFEDSKPLDFQRIIISTENISIDKTLISDSMKLLYSRHQNVVITNKKATKGNAIKTIASKMNVDLQNIIAFGDDLNDIDMFKVCGQGIAMGNAVKELKDIAYDITDSNDNEGIANWINKNIL